MIPTLAACARSRACSATPRRHELHCLDVPENVPPSATPAPEYNVEVSPAASNAARAHEVFPPPAPPTRMRGGRAAKGAPTKALA